MLPFSCPFALKEVEQFQKELAQRKAAEEEERAASEAQYAAQREELEKKFAEDVDKLQELIKSQETNLNQEIGAAQVRTKSDGNLLLLFIVSFLQT